MKKMLYAAGLAAVLPLLFSCGGVQDEEFSFNEPRFIQYAGKLVSADGSLQAVLGESGVYVVGQTTSGGIAPSALRTKSVDLAMEYHSGTYSVNGDVYTLEGWGSLDLSTQGKVTVTRNGSETVLDATFSKTTANNDIYRTWTVDKTRITVGSVAAEFNGCKFREIFDFLAENNYKIQDNILSDNQVRTVSITGSGMLFIIYSDKDADVGSCKVSGSKLSYDWLSEEMGYSFETGNASFEFMDGKCVFTIEARMEDGTQAQVQMVLSDYEGR